MSPRWARVLVATLLITMIGGFSPGVAMAAPRGEGTMQVRQSENCSGTGDDAFVSVPFSLWFTGFTPGAEGTVTAFTSPGGEEVGHGTVTVDADGQACVRVSGDVPPGNYKIVYDFGSGTGKQKVVHIRDSEPQPTESPSSPPPESPSSPPPESPSSPPESPTAPPESPTAPPESPTAPPESPTTPTVTPTTPAVTPTTPSSAPSSTTSSPSTEVGHLKFKQVPKAQVAAVPENLPKTGGLSLAALTVMGSLLLGLGVLLTRTSPRSRRNNS